MDAFGSGVDRQVVLEEASSRPQATLRTVLMKDFEQGQENLSRMFPRITGRRRVWTSRRNPQNQRPLSSNPGREELVDLTRSNLSGSENSAVERNGVPATSLLRPPVVTLLPDQGETRNGRLMGSSSNEHFPSAFSSVRRHQLPPLVTIDDSSSDSENADEEKRRRAQEEADYQLALKISAEWNNGNEGLPSSSSVAESTSYRHPSKHSTDVKRRNGHEFCDLECVICFETPIRPMGCLRCRQLIGCHACVLKWRKTNINSFNRMPPLSRGKAPENHGCCPLCRVKWVSQPEIAPWKEVQSGRTTKVFPLFL